MEHAVETEGEVVSRLHGIVVDCREPAALARWWADVLDHEVRPYSEEDLAWLRDHGYAGPEDDPSVAVDDPAGVGPTLWFNRVPEAKSGKNRLHLDVWGDPEELVSKGASVIAPPEGDRDWTVLADPEGNEFCASTSWPAAPPRPVGDVHELRLVVRVPDFDAATRLYRDVLGMPAMPGVVSEDHGHIVILEAGRATLELTDDLHADHVDHLEVGRTVDGQVRIALGVRDVDGATAGVAGTGAEQLAPPTLTPWGSRNARFVDPAGLQLTLFGE